MKKFSAVLLLVGLVLVALGLALMFVIVPGMKQFPADVDTVRTYDGHMDVLLDAQNMAFLSDLDVQLSRHIKTEETSDGVALVLEEQQLAAGDQVLTQLIKRYAIDRKTMEFASDYPTEWADKAGFWERKGLVIGWPIDPEKRDYAGWSDDYRDTVTLKFEGEVEHERSGHTVYYYTAGNEARPIAPEAVEAMGLPTALTQEEIGALVEGLDMNPMIARSLPLLMQQAEWPDPVPLVYTYEYTGEYWVDPVTGVLIDTHKIEARKVGFSQDLMESLAEKIAALPFDVDPEMVSEFLPVPVFQLEYNQSDQSVQDAAADADDAANQIDLYGTKLPVGLIVVGLLLTAIGAVKAMKKDEAAA